jgi:UDP-N-acetylmuramate dehydrogenase
MENVEVLNNHSLKSGNTFGLRVYADRYFKLAHRSQLQQALAELGRSERSLILGGGSNLLFVGDYHGTVAQVELRGREIVEQDRDHIYLRLGAGENWHEAVRYCVASGWGGIENLSLIPGTVGGAPIQNIGAYGVELHDVLEELETIDLENGVTRKYSRSDCRFGYRDSVFKRKGTRLLILSITLKLARDPVPIITHESVRHYLEEKGIQEPSINDVCEAVTDIRRRKLPDPAVLGNAGSFFKNPVVPIDLYDELREKHPAIPGYSLSGAGIKVPAGWLIEQLGWKERCYGTRCGVHRDQALVIVNHGNASGKDILALANDIAGSVEDRFGIRLAREVQVID